MKDSIFREYDIRGIVGQELFIDQMYDLIRAMAVLFKQIDAQVKTVALAIDGRVHSQQLKEETIRALRDSGLNVLFIGVCPTPVLYFSQFMMPVDAGIMITASHNPAEYNGIKFCINSQSVWGAQITELKELYKRKVQLVSATHGSYEEVDGIGYYVTYLQEHFESLRGMELPVIIDCGNAVGGLVMPRLIEALSWKNVQLLYAELDGTMPNHEADPVVEKNMAEVKEQLFAQKELALGIGFDGDCDRMAPMTKSGYLVPGDQLLAVFSKHILAENPGAAIVFDVRVSAGLIELLESWGAKACLSACGHAIIKNEMKKTGALLAGELSCHFCFKDRYFGYDDGIYAALRLFEILITTKKSLDELVSIFPVKCSSHEIRVACAQQDKQQVVDQVKKIFAARVDTNLITIDGVRVSMPYGWGLVRASNTQEVLSIRFESDSAENLMRVKKDFIEAMEPFFEPKFLEQELIG